MPNFLKKALGLFVEFEPDEKKASPSPQAEEASLAEKFPLSNIKGSISSVVESVGVLPGQISDTDIDKFENHFAELFDKSNLPGPDYFEFWRMMETLETAVPDEKVRMSAVFATLAVQGLTKDKLVDSAAQYNAIIEKDKGEFEAAVNGKLQTEVEGRKRVITQMEDTIASNSATIKKLTEEITELQKKMTLVKDEIEAQEKKLVTNMQAYLVACKAMSAKIQTDIQTIKNSL